MAVAETNLVIHEVRYEVTLDHVAKLGDKFKGLTATTAEGYEMVRLAISDLRGIRGRIEARRVELKKDALEYGRKVDAVAHQLTDAIEVIEQPLKVMKGRVDDEKARIKADREAAERAEVEAKLRAEREAEEAKSRAARQAEEAKLREERAAFEAAKKKADDERAAADAVRRAEDERLAAERKAIEDERRKLDEEKRQREREEFQRQATAKAEREAAEKVARERVEREQKAAEAVRAAEAEHQRLEALRPDVEKVAALAVALLAVPIPEVADLEAEEEVEEVIDTLGGLAARLDAWVAHHRTSKPAA